MAHLTMRSVHRNMVSLALAALAIAPGAGLSQEDRMARPPAGEATIYRDDNYSGPAVFVGQARPDLGLAWPVNSIRVARGTWELCEQRNYRGTCRRVDRDTARFRRGGGITIQSMRPVGAGGSQPGAPGNNQSLRGNAAQFYPAPARNGYRVAACERDGASASCAANSARAFCQAMGWRQAADHAVQTVSGRRYLADVLCR